MWYDEGWGEGASIIAHRRMNSLALCRRIRNTKPFEIDLFCIQHIPNVQVEMELLTKSRYVKIRKLDNLRAETTRHATERANSSLPEGRCYTVTLDQGKEFARLIGATELFPEGVYFAHPGCPWERGTNEDTNGEIRQFLPKGTDLSQCTHQKIRKVEDSGNNRPRK